MKGDQRIEVKCPDSEGISIATLGRKCVSYPLGVMFSTLSYVISSFDDIEDSDFVLIDEFENNYVNGVTKKLARSIMEFLRRINFESTVDLENLVKPSKIFQDVDALFLAYADGWELIQKRDFDKRLRYSRYSGGLVKLGLR